MRFVLDLLKLPQNSEIGQRTGATRSLTVGNSCRAPTYWCMVTLYTYTWASALLVPTEWAVEGLSKWDEQRK